MMLAQTQWQVGAYGQYEVDVRGLRRVQVQGISPGVMVGFKKSLPSAEVGIYLHARYERIREDSTEILKYQFAANEALQQDNLVFGPALQVVIFPEKKFQLLLGVDIYVGIPIRTFYEYFGPLPLGTPGAPIYLPSYTTLDGGAGALVGWQSHLGVAGKLTPRQEWQLRLGYGYGDQTYDWTDLNHIDEIGRLHSGRYMYVSLGTMYEL
ncbi:MAG: hypothetical protein AAFZ63_27600 [Bacteroidota bacterium]